MKIKSKRSSAPTMHFGVHDTSDKRRVRIFIACLGLIIATATMYWIYQNRTSAAVTVPTLKVSGNKIVDSLSGQPVVLRGANVLRSEWDLRMDAERIGIPKLAQEWKGNVVVRGFASDPVRNSNFTWTSPWGQTVTHSTYMSWLDEHVALAESNGMYIVFSFRSFAINGPQPVMPDDGAQEALAKLAARYKGKPNVLYGLQVEPHDVTWSQLHPRFVQMVDAVHAAASPYKPIVMVPGITWGRDLSGAIVQPIQRENIVYKTHQWNSKADFQKYFLNAHDAGLPIFIGEFGAHDNPYMSMDDVSALITVARDRGIGWAAWAFDYRGGPALVTDNTSFNPISPYGVAVKNEMLATPPLPSGIPPTKAGDTNNDGLVNGLDLSKVLTNYGKSLSGPSNGDTNYDGIVNALDLSLVLAQYDT